ncbi:hypothetical protein BXZ70DRAFT_1067315 [Cristinia sonorae]|uniref:DUF6532 domain-containing protein n=1 Tax=Cristinia sonorae TaxID=1940300 RepID=A0A8K0UH80_9AGAR|nr:hypothetical protein BXZ70DRAFT_1067315 [Cristinia sonorae]
MAIGISQEFKRVQREKIKHLKLKTPEQVASWARKSVEGQGAAFWRVPEENGQRATGALQSEYILHAFAHHLKHIEGSMLDQLDIEDFDSNTPPIGAIALAATVVQLSFSKYQTGTYNSVVKFSDSEPSVMAIWGGHLKNAHHICKNSERLNEFVSLAMEHVKPGRRSTRAASSNNVMAAAPVVIDSYSSD